MSDLPDPITLEIIRHRLDGINDEAAMTLRRVSGSQIAVEANDLNTAITTADGTVVACGKYVLCQVASLNLVAADVLTNYVDNPGIRPGDQFLTNDPYVGTLHQPDVVLIAPVFHDGRLIAWCGSTVHQSDVGGGTAGGLSLDSQSIFDEPLPIPPVRIVEQDRLRRDIERSYLVRSRTPRLNALDLAGQIAANRAAVHAVQALCSRYGASAVVAAMDHLVDVAETQLRDRLSGLPDGRWRQVSYLERGEPTDDNADVYAVRLVVTKSGDELELDFTGSSPQAPGGINAAYPALVNFSIASVLIYLCADLLWVPGAIPRVVRIVSTEGSVVHARWPAGVSMSTATSCQAIRLAVSGCLSRMLEGSDEHTDRSMAGCQSSGAGGGVLSGVGRTGTAFSSMTLDELTGGGGATASMDGADSSGSTTSPGAACANVEVNESYLPVLYLERRELADSAGPGQRRGGSGCSITMTPHGTTEPIRVVSFAQGLQHPAAIGSAGGDPGRQSLFAVLPAAGPAWQDAIGDLPLPDAAVRLTDGLLHLAATQGGGGHGDPLDRNVDDVVADVVDGLVTREGAVRDYGVVLSSISGQPKADIAATSATRARMLRDRIGGREPAVRLDRRPGRRLSQALDVMGHPDGDHCVCARCGADLGAADRNPYQQMAMQEVSMASVAPWPVRYPGADRFVVRRLHCPRCAVRIDVQIALRTDPIVQAAAPATHPVGRARDGW